LALFWVNINRSSKPILDLLKIAQNQSSD
jgi:hypothetical protein